MEKKILEAIYEGEVYPIENIMQQNPDYLAICNKAGDEIEYLRKTLSTEEVSHFDIMIEYTEKHSSMYNYAAFSYGFRLGVNLLVEALSNTSDLSGNN